MVLALQTLGLVVLLSLTAVGPGLAVVGRLRWKPLEKFVAATASSFIAIYLCGFGLFIAAAPPAAYWTAATVLAAITLVQWRRIARLWQSPAVRIATVGYLVLCAWLFLLLCLVRHYGGGYWAGDWAEHYQRTAVFLHLLPIDTKFLGLFTLPARPPMMNVIAAFYCRLCGISNGQLRFESFSLIFLLLNAWVFLPAVLLLQRFLAWRRRRLNSQTLAILAALFVLNPFIAQNATWTWTKLLCAGYVLLALHFYLRSRNSGNRARNYLIASFVFLAAALMVHFTAWPYAAVIGLHALWKRRRGLPVAIAAAVALLAVWFAWSLSVFGFAGTFGAYFAAPASAMELAVPPWARMAQNLVFSIVPQPPVKAELAAWFVGDSPLTLVRDYWFEISQSNLIVMVGSIGGIIAWWLVLRALMPKRRAFWRWLVLFCALTGILSTSRLERFGAGMLCEPLLVGVMVYLAAMLPELSILARAAAVAGCAIDFVLGIALHFWLQNAVFTATPASGGMLVQHDGFNVTEAANWWSKQMLHLIFWGDRAAPLAGMLMAAVCLMAAGALAALVWGLAQKRR